MQSIEIIGVKRNLIELLTHSSKTNKETNQFFFLAYILFLINDIQQLQHLSLN
jgi:hypothetical protein